MRISAWLVLATATAILAMGDRGSAQQEQDPTGRALLERAGARYKGDLDSLMEKGVLRVLIAPNRTSFFFAERQPRGFEHDLLEKYEKTLRKKTRKRFDLIYLPVRREELLPALLEGRGDIAAAGLTVTDERQSRVAFSDPYLTKVDEIVVTSADAAGLDRLEDLSGRKVYVAVGSSYVEHLARLNEDFRRRGLESIEVEQVGRHMETEDILEMVNGGIVDLTVVDRHIAEVWSSVLTQMKLRPDLAINRGGSLAWAVRKEDAQLLADLNRFVKLHKKGTLLGNIFFKRYYRSAKWVQEPTAAEEARLDELDDHFQKYGERYGFDWLLIAALSFRESRFDQSVRSHAGAVGAMQVLPSTAADSAVNIPDVETNVENNVHAGVKYMAWLRDNFFNEPGVSPAAKVDFTLAAYNAGPGRIRQMRRRASSDGYDPDEWFDNVEEVTLRVVGWEPVRYVASINKYYFQFRLTRQAMEERARERDAARRPPGLP